MKDLTLPRVFVGTVMFGIIVFVVGQYFLPMWLVSTIGSILVFGGLFLLTKEAVKFNRKYALEKSRPIVCKWEHNGDTIITSKPIYELSFQLREHLLEIFDISPEKFKTPPLIYAAHNNHRSGDVLTDKELQNILTSCSVQMTEMLNPLGGSGRELLVGYEKMWRLLHGKDSIPPMC
jgi:hypothetical protein